MTTPYSVLIALAVTLTLKPLYYVQLSTIAVMLGKNAYPPGIWRYDRMELLSLLVLSLGLAMLLRFQGVVLGVAVGAVGIAYLLLIHTRYTAALRRVKEEPGRNRPD